MADNELVGKIHRFNTGRLYTERGQVITWAIVKHDGNRFVVFSDEDRQIDGLIPLFLGNYDLIDNGWVLRAYDDHHWMSANYYLLNDLRNWIEALPAPLPIERYR